MGSASMWVCHGLSKNGGYNDRKPLGLTGYIPTKTKQTYIILCSMLLVTHPTKDPVRSSVYLYTSYISAYPHRMGLSLPFFSTSSDAMISTVTTHWVSIQSPEVCPVCPPCVVSPFYPRCRSIYFRRYFRLPQKFGLPA